MSASHRGRQLVWLMWGAAALAMLGIAAQAAAYPRGPITVRASNAPVSPGDTLKTVVSGAENRFCTVRVESPSGRRATVARHTAGAFNDWAVPIDAELGRWTLRAKCGARGAAQDKTPFAVRP